MSEGRGDDRPGVATLLEAEPRRRDREGEDRQDAAADTLDRKADLRYRASLYAGRVGVGLLFLLAWELLSGRVVKEFFLSKPSLIIGRFVELATTGELWPHLSTTMLETGMGLAIGMLLGVLLGLAIALSRLVGQWVYPYIIALYSLPRVALAPLFIVWFGIGLMSKVIMVITMVVFVVFYNTYEGVRNIDHDLLDMTKSYRASWWQALRWVILPSVAPWLLTALRLSIGLGLIGGVISELIGASAGLGYYIKQSSNLYDTTGVFTGLVIITLIAMILEQIVAQVEKRVLRYR